jgi:hypothetical protein
MQVRKTSISDLYKALDIVNQKYSNNIEFRTIEERGRIIRFRLKVKKYSLPGYAVSARSRDKNKLSITGSACWHVHGDFFDALLGINKNAIIRAGRSLNGAYRITSQGGNWQDYNIGGTAYPFFASEACNCNILMEPENQLPVLANQIKKWQRSFYERLISGERNGLAEHWMK